ncbi:thermonuclease family protein [Agrobacterium tumefaciens]|uniref:Nuclease n=1 Tax=Agrobacterium tumefaciens TaxID=358 RepID=A0A2L2LI72_AGRTU|nr:nuclease [Agrobacterium tumefaciens]
MMKIFAAGVASVICMTAGVASAGQGVSCASLVVIDGDTIKCDGQNMRLLGGGVPFKSGVDAPEMGSRAKCEFERDLALKAKARLKELLLAGVPRIEDSGARDRTQSRRPLVNIHLPDGREAGQVLMSEGLAREWRAKHSIDWCN